MSFYNCLSEAVISALFSLNGGISHEQAKGIQRSRQRFVARAEYQDPRRNGDPDRSRKAADRDSGWVKAVLLRHGGNARPATLTLEQALELSRQGQPVIARVFTARPGRPDEATERHSVHLLRPGEGLSEGFIMTCPDGPISQARLAAEMRRREGDGFNAIVITKATGKNRR